MKIDDLSKTQLILLGLLISFVTSIATGIVTVSLMDQAPPGLTQTVNRVVEKTIETVVPGKTIKVEVPVVMTEEDLILAAVEKATPTVATLSDMGTGFYIGADKFVIVVSSASTSPELKVVNPTATSTAFLKLAKADPRIGQYAIAVEPSGGISSGLVTSYLKEENIFQTDIRSSTTGSPVVSIYGEVIGVYLSGGRVIPISVLK